MNYPSNGQLQTDLWVYPNPAEELVAVSGLRGNTTYSVIVRNSLGMTVLAETQLSSNVLGELQISVGSLSSGIYFIQLKGATGTMMAKFVKQ